VRAGAPRTPAVVALDRPDGERVEAVCLRVVVDLLRVREGGLLGFLPSNGRRCPAAQSSTKLERLVPTVDPGRAVERPALNVHVEPGHVVARRVIKRVITSSYAAAIVFTSLQESAI